MQLFGIRLKNWAGPRVVTFKSIIAAAAFSSGIQLTPNLLATADKVIE
jgi:hypothetical protein